MFFRGKIFLSGFFWVFYSRNLGLLNDNDYVILIGVINKK